MKQRKKNVFLKKEEEKKNRGTKQKKKHNKTRIKKQNAFRYNYIYNEVIYINRETQSH